MNLVQSSQRDRTGPAPSRRLPRESRLRLKRDFQRVYTEGVRVRGRLILLVAAPGLNPTTARLGLSVGRRFSRRAVLRNRQRRRLREAFRLERPGLPRLDLVLIPVTGRPAATLDELRDELVTLSSRADRKLRCGEP